MIAHVLVNQATNTTDCYDINEILLKVALNTINPNPSISCNLRQWFLCNISACLLVGSGQMLHIFRQRIYISNNHYYWAYYRGNAHSFVLKDNLGFQIYTKRIYLVRFKHEMVPSHRTDTTWCQVCSTCEWNGDYHK
jgi:hypothetical protein